VRCGKGNRHVSIIAGCHADEPAGPMTAQALPLLLNVHFPELLERYTFFIVPQINLDGAARNRAWFQNPPDFQAYFSHAVREAPGDDVEFGFAKAPAVRPECQAVMDFLAPRAPFRFHCSLHGMPFAEGAWFLICQEWAALTVNLRDGLTELCERMAIPLHDIDRQGDKGFHRIAPGFCTTPHSAGMRKHFLEAGDAETAGRFLPSSMEFVSSLGGAPLCMVSEMPLFLVGARVPGPGGSAFARLKEALDAIRSGHETAKGVDGLIAEYAVTPVPFEAQIRLQFAMIVLGLSEVSY
jgi:hypothetical protein